MGRRGGLKGRGRVEREGEGCERGGRACGAWSRLWTQRCNVPPLTRSGSALPWPSLPPTQVDALDEMGLTALSAEKTPVVVLVSSSTGDGDPPDNATRFYGQIKRRGLAPDLLKACGGEVPPYLLRAARVPFLHKKGVGAKGARPPSLSDFSETLQPGNPQCQPQHCRACNTPSWGWATPTTLSSVAFPGRSGRSWARWDLPRHAMGVGRDWDLERGAWWCVC